MELQAAREKLSLTQLQVAEMSKTSERMYQNYEYGTEPAVGTAIRIGKAVKVKNLKEFYALWERKTPDGNQA